MEVLDPQTMVDRIHKTPHRGVIHAAGGGSGVLPLLMKRGGGSATVLNASTPHGVKAVPSLLGYDLSTPNRWPKAVSSAVARGLAMVAYQQAVQLCEDEPVFGIGCTVSLAKTPSERINREHKGYVVLQTQDATIEISFSSHQSDRVTEEEMVERIILDLVANGCGLVHLTCRSEAERQSHKTIHASAATCNHMQLPSLILREMPFIIYRLNPGNMPEQVAIDSLSRDGLTFLSGSFNPPHQGHRAMRKISTSYTGEPCHLELSITNANKPPLDYLTIQERLVRIAEEGDEGYLYLTNKGTFAEKANIFHNATFAIGYDTWERIISGVGTGGTNELDRIYNTFKSCGTKFIVFGRVDDQGNFKNINREELWSRASLDNSAYSHLTKEEATYWLTQAIIVSETLFRQDISSTNLREVEQQCERS